MAGVRNDTNITGDLASLTNAHSVTTVQKTEMVDINIVFHLKVLPISNESRITYPGMSQVFPPGNLIPVQHCRLSGMPFD